MQQGRICTDLNTAHQRVDMGCTADQHSKFNAMIDLKYIAMPTVTA